MQSDARKLQREVDHLFHGCELYKALIDSLADESPKSEKLAQAEIDVLDEKMKELSATIEKRSVQLKETRLRRAKLASKMLKAIQLGQNSEMLYNDLHGKVCSLKEEQMFLTAEHDRVLDSLHRLMQINALNDAFYIWFCGPFATINGFRVGKLANFPQLDWPEINAGLGQAALAISSISIKANYEFKKYLIMPMGSFARVALVADRRQTYNLHTDGSFSLFASTKKNFNAALIGLLFCIEELGEHVKSLDPTLTLPHVISASEGKINDIPISYGADEEQWTKALKYMLTCIKWIIAWSTKHIYHRSLLRG